MYEGTLGCFHEGLEHPQILSSAGFLEAIPMGKKKDPTFFLNILRNTN